MRREKQYGSYDENGVAHLVTESSLGEWAVTIAFCTFSTDENGKARQTSDWQESVAKLHVPWREARATSLKTVNNIFQTMGRVRQIQRHPILIYGMQ